MANERSTRLSRRGRSLVLLLIFSAMAAGQLVATEPGPQTFAFNGPTFESPTATAARRTYDRALRDARLQYLRLLEGALIEVMKRDDLAEAERIQAVQARLTAEHLKDGGDAIRVIRMLGTRSWEDSDIEVRRGQRIQVSASDAAINKRKVETVHGIAAPVGSLLMKIGGRIHEVGTGTEIVAESDGRILFRSNLRVSPNHKLTISVVVKGPRDGHDR